MTRGRRRSSSRRQRDALDLCRVYQLSLGQTGYITNTALRLSQECGWVDPRLQVLRESTNKARIRIALLDTGLHVFVSREQKTQRYSPHLDRGFIAVIVNYLEP